MQARAHDGRRRDGDQRATALCTRVGEASTSWAATAASSGWTRRILRRRICANPNGPKRTRVHTSLWPEWLSWHGFRVYRRVTKLRPPAALGRVGNAPDGRGASQRLAVERHALDHSI